jgi:hypothetical protein
MDGMLLSAAGALFVGVSADTVVPSKERGDTVEYDMMHEYVDAVIAAAGPDGIPGDRDRIDSVMRDGGMAVWWMCVQLAVVRDRDDVRIDGGFSNALARLEQCARALPDGRSCALLGLLRTCVWQSHAACGVEGTCPLAACMRILSDVFGDCYTNVPEYLVAGRAE